MDWFLTTCTFITVDRFLYHQDNNIPVNLFYFFKKAFEGSTIHGHVSMIGKYEYIGINMVFYALTFAGPRGR